MVSCLGSLVHHAAGREGHCRQISLVGVGALSVFQPHWVCPCSWHGCFPCLHCSGSRLLSRERTLSCLHFPGLSHSGSGSRVLHKGADSVRPAFCAFPCPSSSGSQELDKHTLPGHSAPYPLRGPSLSSWVRWFGVPCVPSGKLISGCDPPGRCQPSRISGSLWLEAGSLFAIW